VRKRRVFGSRVANSFVGQLAVAPANYSGMMKNSRPESLSMNRPLMRLTIALSLSVGTIVHGADDFVLSRFTDYLEALRTQAGIPGLAAAIIGRDTVTWERAFGQQDLDRNIAMRLDTPFELDGTTQAIMGSLLVRCAADGRLSLGDPVSKFAPSSPEAGAALWQFLTHTTPAGNSLTFSYRPERLGPLSGAVASCTDLPFRTGIASVLDRLAMTDSVPGSDILGGTATAEGFTASALQRYASVLARLATPYTVDARGRATASANMRSTLTPYSGMISTVRDLEQFDLALKSGFLLSPEWLSVAWTPPKDATGKPLPHAYGWFVQDYNGERIVWQFGVSDNGTSSMIMTVPRRATTLILLANSPGLARPFSLANGDITVSPFARLFFSIFLR
jgi:CubicO group peptidase (beta-lactamase class C family)